MVIWFLNILTDIKGYLGNLSIFFSFSNSVVNDKWKIVKHDWLILIIF